MIEDIHDPHHMLKSRSSHIFPTLVKKFNPLHIKTFRVITKANHGKQSISTIRMLNIKLNDTSPGSCKFKIVLIFSFLNFSYRLYYLIRRSLGLCMARILCVIQLQCSPSIAFGCILLVRKSSCLQVCPPQNWHRITAF